MKKFLATAPVFVSLLLLIFTNIRCGLLTGEPDPTPSSSPTTCTLGTTWALANDYQYSPSQSAQAFHVGSASGNIFVVGTANDSGAKARWVVRKSSDKGSSWTNTDDYILASGQGAYAMHFFASAAGDLYVMGYAYDSSTKLHWIVRKSTNGGTTWSTVDDYVLASGQHAKAEKMAEDSSGNLYVTGYGTDSSSNLHWITRKSTNAGSSWSTVDDYFYAASQHASAKGIAISSSGVIYTVGSGNAAGPVGHWIVRKSTNSGSTWTTVDDYLLNAGQSANSASVIVDSSNRVFAVGTGNDSSGKNHWIVRKSTDSGSTWTVAENYVHTTNQNSFGATHASLDSLGSLWVIGYVYDGTKTHWIVRTTADGGTAWTLSEDYLYNLNTYGRGIAKDSEGNLYAVGEGTDGGAITHWTVRKLACQSE